MAMMSRGRFLALAVLLPAALIARVSAAPRLVMPETEFNFGYVPQNAQVAHVFWLHSKGDDSLKVIQVIPGCGCTRAPLEKDALAVGDSTRLEIIFDTRSYQGGVTKTPRIQTNEGPPDKTVRIMCDVLVRPDSSYPIILKPYKLDMLQFGEKVRDVIKFTIQNVSDRTISTTLVSAPEDLLDVTLPKQVLAGKTAEGLVRLKKSALNKAFEKSITIQLDDEKNSRFTLPVKRALRTDAAAASPTPAGTPTGH